MSSFTITITERWEVVATELREQMRKPRFDRKLIDRLTKQFTTISELQVRIWGRFPGELLEIHERSKQVRVEASNIDQRAEEAMRLRLETLQAALDASDDAEESAALRAQVSRQNSEMVSRPSLANAAKEEFRTAVQAYVDTLIEATGLEEPKHAGGPPSQFTISWLLSFSWLNAGKKPLTGTPEQNAIAEDLSNLAVLENQLMYALYNSLGYETLNVPWEGLLKFAALSVFDDSPRR